ncbi:hypothetical protein QTJ16_007073 [Diplocarpon rosae]|uniref:acylphosphatase n=1 Tax=Diplocarpon rosae TaxID=946125 RepID=A0AAD9SUV4_9HELO|nr:hypothetical protein QTJ16_007073 [Diplocarpon rosae]
MTKRLSFRVHGGVQGVGFRYFTREKAASYGLTGWVRNTRDCKVEGEAQGSETELEQFMKDLETGPSQAEVARLEKEEIGVLREEKGFEIQR